MKSFQAYLQQDRWSEPLPDNSESQLVLAFGDRNMIAQATIQEQLKRSFPKAEIVGCTTSGEIHNTEVYTESVSLMALTFEKTTVSVVDANIKDFTSSVALGKHLVKALPTENLKHVFILSDGQLVNGTDLVAGIADQLPDGILATGGLAGDGVDFQQTKVWRNGEISEGLVLLVGFYGDALKVGHGHLGGWKAFGANRVITTSNANVLYEIDGRPALELYKSFLGKYADELPASALLFPLALTTSDEEESVVRTILSVNEEDNSMTFAGNMPEGANCQLMRANYENLVDGAHSAAEMALTKMTDMKAQAAILISCVGRRLVLDQRTEEELEVVSDVLGHCPMTGFYSYGEISPLITLGKCGLHNQTMTITLFAESDQ